MYCKLFVGQELMFVDHMLLALIQTSIKLLASFSVFVFSYITAP